MANSCFVLSVRKSLLAIRSLIQLTAGISSDESFCNAKLCKLGGSHASNSPSATNRSNPLKSLLVGLPINRRSALSGEESLIS